MRFYSTYFRSSSWRVITYQVSYKVDLWWWISAFISMLIQSRIFNYFVKILSYIFENFTCRRLSHLKFWLLLVTLILLLVVQPCWSSKCEVIPDLISSGPRTVNLLELMIATNLFILTPNPSLWSFPKSLERTLVLTR